MDNNEIDISPRKRRLERERKQRREDIIKTAEWFFINRGFKQTMVDQIALKAGYSKATIYNYFDSKDDLFIAVVSKVYQKLFQIMETALNQPEVKYELLSLGEAYLIFVDKYPDYAAFFDSGRLDLVIRKIIQKEELNQTLTESEKEFRYHQLKIQELMINVITETMNSTGIQTKLDPFSVVMVLSTLNSAIRELVMRGKRSNQPEKKSREYLTILFKIIDKGLKHYDE
ncbi:MAG: TetR/AcrR family transcriptional regulator [Candidatus Hermodarchaeota archaeon]